MMTSNTLCIDLKSRNIRVFIPHRFIPPRCIEIIMVLSQTPLCCGDDVYRIFEPLTHLPNPGDVSPRAVTLALAVVLSNADFLFNDKQRMSFSVFFKDKGYRLVYDRANGLWAPPELLRYPPALQTKNRPDQLH